MLYIRNPVKFGLFLNHIPRDTTDFICISGKNNYLTFNRIEGHLERTIVRKSPDPLGREASSLNQEIFSQKEGRDNEIFYR